MSTRSSAITPERCSRTALVQHVYMLRDGLVERMDVRES